jgi:hypothetical protein
MIKGWGQQNNQMIRGSVIRPMEGPSDDVVQPDSCSLLVVVLAFDVSCLDRMATSVHE